MTRNEAYRAMLAGRKITHRYFSDGEFYERKDGNIIAEDGVNHSDIFWATDGDDWRADGWELFNEPTNQNNGNDKNFTAG